MRPVSIHQAIHGYREGHRLLSSSLSLNADSARAMLVLSDMSGPAMQPGFDEYLTAYPLPGSELYVFGKTWYAPEMQRPGCVWTHSLLLSREQVSRVSAAHLLTKFVRPQPNGVESSAPAPLELDVDTSADKLEGFLDATVSAALVGAVLGQARPVIVTVETANRLEPAFLRLWDELWPAAKARFSFCTGALLPRSVAGALMDLQAIPRAIPSSQFRKSAGAALVLDLRNPSATEPWVDLFLDGTHRGAASFRSWLEEAAGGDASREVVPSLVPIFAAWHAQDSSARSVLAIVMAAKELDPNARSRLLGMVFNRAYAEAGALGRREILQEASKRRDADFPSIATALEGQTCRLFDESRAEGVALVLSLLGGELTEVGERVLRAAMLLLAPSDLEFFGSAHTPLLPTIVGENPKLASSPEIWSRVGDRGAEVLLRLSHLNPSDEERGKVLDAIISSGCDMPVDAFLRFGGKTAIFRALTAMAAGRVQLSWPWRSALARQPETVIEWLEGLSPPSLRDLELGSCIVSPQAMQSRLAMVWKSGVDGASSGAMVPRVAAFGLSLAVWEGAANSPLLAACFQLTYDAAGSSRLEYEEWEWLREYAPPLSYWRDWDKCERLALAIGRLFGRQSAPLETVFWVVRSQSAIMKIADVLDDDWRTRSYLKSLRKAAESSPIGTLEQRNALLRR
jgi:hypothetical protein